MSKYDVICIGQVVQDVLTTNVPLDALSDRTDTVLADKLLITIGGDAANEACILSRLGTKVAFAGRVDKRNVGNMVYAALEEEGIDMSLVVRPDDCETITSIVIIHPDGNHHFIVGPGKNCTPQMCDFDFDMFKDVKAVTVGSLFGLGTMDTDGIEKVYEAAQAAGTLTFADMTYDLDGIGPKGVEKIYPFTDYMMPSLDEATYVTGKSEPDDIADYFLERGAKNVVIKMGGKGCFFKNKEERFYVDPFVIKPLDTTGCGDNFTASFVHARLKGLSHKECAEFASAAGAMNTQEIGAHFYIKSEQQVLDFMANTPRVPLNRE